MDDAQRERKDDVSIASHVPKPCTLTRRMTVWTMVSDAVPP